MAPHCLQHCQLSISQHIQPPCGVELARASGWIVLPEGGNQNQPDNVRQVVPRRILQAIQAPSPALAWSLQLVLVPKRQVNTRKRP